MPTNNMAKLCQKAVLISVYVEKPTKRKISSNSHRHNHHYYGDKGYNRRAELLLYSRSLRESAPSHPKPLPSANVTYVQRKPKRKQSPACPGKWGILNLNLCKSFTSVQINNTEEKEAPCNYYACAKKPRGEKKEGFRFKISLNAAKV